MTQALGRQIGNRLSLALILGALIPIMPLLGGPTALGLSAIYLVTRPGKILKLTDQSGFGQNTQIEIIGVINP